MANRRLSALARGLRDFAVRRFPALLVALALVVTLVFAFTNPGIPTTRVDVNDGGIWVTNEAKQLVGHLNYESRTYDSGLRSRSASFEIGQYRDTVTFNDTAASSVAGIEAAAVRLGTATSLPEKAIAVQGGTRLGILNPDTGQLWIGDAADPGGATLTDEAAVASDLEGGVVTAGVDGSVLAIAAGVARMVVVPAGTAKATTNIPVSGLSAKAELSLTAVGDQPVALDSASNTLILPDGSKLDLTKAGVETGGVLQQPGPAADHVLLATAQNMVSIPLAGGEPSQASTMAASGRPAAPVRLNGCEYGAWAGSGAWLRRCDSGSDPILQVSSSIANADAVVFRTNRDLIVLNQVSNGNVWLPDHNMVLANNWDQIEKELKAKEKKTDSPDDSEEIQDPDHKTDTPPEVKPDEFGVRPGRATTLDVLANDSDSDGDILTASQVDPPTFGTVEQTRGGQALRIDVPKDTPAGAKTKFNYQASDGKYAASTTAEVTVHPYDQNKGPVQQRNPSIKLGSKAQVTYNVLPDWRDPDGDPIFLSGVSHPKGIQVQFREEGTITVRDLGADPKRIQLEVTVSDNYREVGQGILTIDLQRPGNLRPVANGDFYVGRVNENIQLQPLANDTDPNADTLHLNRVSPAKGGASMTAQTELGVANFKASKSGTYYLSYTVDDGVSKAFGVMRIDVVEQKRSARVVAEDDMVLLPEGGAALAAPLVNDTDPSGGVLVVQSITVDDKSLEVTLVDHHLLRITSQVDLEDEATITYVASNGDTTATAKVLVVPTKAADNKRAPVLQSDRGTVRVGDIGSVAVLDNDRSPAGLRMWVDPKLTYTPDPEVGTPFVTGNEVRLEAGQKAGHLRVSYAVRDTAGNLSTSQVLFEVRGQDGANTEPRPAALTAWAVSGQPVRIPVPLAGIDPDGDSVTLVGIDQTPERGTAQLGTDWLIYTPAPEQTGSDVFTYIVEDRGGKQSTARVRVGIAPPSKLNQPPSAVRDSLLIRPGRTLTIPVAENDIDPDGDELQVDPNGLEPTNADLHAEVVGASIVVTTPGQPGTYGVAYRILDGRGGSDTGMLTLNVAADAPKQAPQARDDVLSSDEVLADGSEAIADVLINDSDPDGDVNKLQVQCDEEGVTVSGNKLLITPDKARRLVVYSITDQDGLVGQAVVSVPGTEQSRPTLDPTKVPIEVRAGQDVTLDLDELVLTRAGRAPHLNKPETVRVSVGLVDTPVVKNDHVVQVQVEKDFVGDTGLSLEVSDGTGEDRSAMQANLTIPIRVVPSVNQPPVLTPTPIEVAKGEGAVTANLAQMVTDLDGSDPATFEYKLVSGISDVTTRLVGHELSVEVPVSYPKGPAGDLKISVDDGSGAVVGTFPVTVRSSNRPLVLLSEIRDDEVNAGSTKTFDIAESAINPFPQTPLKVVKSWVVTGSGVTISHNKTKIQVTVPSNFHGLVEAAYNVMDATQDADRMVRGRILLTVRDRPDPPTDVEVKPSGAGDAVVTFQPGANNGSEIDRYQLTDRFNGKDYSCNSGTPPCQVSGLSNGDKHSFTVRAGNAVGLSDASEPSAAVLIDVAPERPDPPVCRPADKSITCSWDPPSNKGSSVVKYILSVNSEKTIEVNGEKTSATIDGLTNGSPYSVRVQAKNRAEAPSEASEASTAVTPYGPPDGPTSIDVTMLPPDNELARAKVGWQLPSSNNGSDWDQALIRYEGGEQKVAATERSAIIRVPAGQESDLWVSLSTKGGWSDEVKYTFRATSVPVSIGKPDVSANGNDGQVSVSGANTKAGNGYRSQELTVQYSTGGDNWQALPADNVIRGLTNGNSVRIQFRQFASSNYQAAGPEVQSEAVTPYGPPHKPTLNATSTTTGATFRWNSDSGNGRDVTRIVLTVAGNEVVDGSQLDGSYDYSAAPGTTVQAKVRACYANGTCTSSDQQQVTTGG